MQIDKLKTFIQSSNINFLFGSGLSNPYLSTLGNIEKWLTELNDCTNIDSTVRNIIEASIYKVYFEQVIYPNQVITDKKKYNDVIQNYKDFLTIWNEILNKRANKLLPKQVNIYTSNIDTFVEKAAEDTAVEFNDGFKGSIHQIYNEGNFQKSLNKTSLHYKNTFEIPIFNLLKMHGSINWNNLDGTIHNDIRLEQVTSIQKQLQNICQEYFVDVKKEHSLNEIITSAYKIKDKYKSVDFATIYKGFFDEYHKLIMVNPTKRKFSETVMDIHFYELMRLFSNSLEKENCVLFVMGFSFADEHIREIALRAANTNPTLEIVIFSYDTDYVHKEIQSKASNNNVHIFNVADFKENNKPDDSINGIIKKWENFDLATINQVFSIVNSKIHTINGHC